VPECPAGVARTMTEPIRQLATSVTNLWEDSLYPKLLDHLLRILLRLHLAPNREQRTMARRRFL
ncbi:hypothetical protein BGZ65_010705, partial [Modicella reniformis]